MRLLSFFVLASFAVACDRIGSTAQREGDLPSPSAAGAVAAAASSAALSSLVSSFAGEAAVWIGDPGAREPVFTINADRQVVAASLYKLGVLLEVERRVEAGELSYTDPVEITEDDVTIDGSNEVPGTVLSVDGALEEMIDYSDNGAALALLRTLGPPKVDATLQGAGIRDFHVAVDTNEDHTVTARAVATFFTLLADGRLLSPAASARMRQRLERQQINDGLPARLPPGTAVAHKTGDLVGFTHDAGIIRTPAGSRVVVALTWGASETDAKAFLAALGRIAYDGKVARLP